LKISTPSPKPKEISIKPTKRPVRRPTRTPVRKQSSNLFKDAQQYADEKEYRMALKLLNEELNLNPGNSDASRLQRSLSSIIEKSSRRLIIADEHYNAKRYEDAKSVLMTLMADDPNNTAAEELLRKVKQKLSERPQLVFQIVGIQIPVDLEPDQTAGISVVVESPNGIKRTTLYYRTKRKLRWKEIDFSDLPGGRLEKMFVIPSKAVSKHGLKIYLEVEDLQGNVITRGSRSNPFEVNVKQEKAIPLPGM